MRVFVYGLFKGDECVYVGRTKDLVRRTANHRVNLGSDGFDEVRILKKVNSATANASERKQIQFYKARGQAKLNICGITPAEWIPLYVNVSVHSKAKYLAAITNRRLNELATELLEQPIAAAIAAEHAKQEQQREAA